jgi:RND family efflux transporter MFP subunit
MVTLRTVSRAAPALLLLAAGLAAPGCADKGKPPVPAAAEKPRAEGDLAHTTLAKEAVDSLHIATAPVVTKPVQEHLQLTGWVMAKQGNEVTITAPVAGYVREPGDGNQPPVAGTAVKKGQPLFTLEPVLSPVEQVQMATLKRAVENELAKARGSLKFAQSEMERIADLHKQGLRGQQDLDKARVNLDHARFDLSTAEDKQKLFATSTVVIRAPRSGNVLSVPVSPGQYVTAAAPLITVADLTVPWVRVPVPEHDLPALNRQDPVSVVLRSAGQGAGAQHRFEGRPIAVVPQVDPGRHTADLLYEITPGAHKAGAPEPGLFAKDLMVTVFVPLGRESVESVVPYAAVVFDVHGSAWVYLDRGADQAGTHKYERRRVDLGASVRDGVVIHPAAQAGDRVVTAGAALLFSREFHKPPVK